MKLKYQAPLRYRVKKRAVGYSPADDFLMWNASLKRWEGDMDRQYEYDSMPTCRSIRAFRRHLRKYAPKGVKFVLYSRYEGHNVFGIGSKP